MRLLTTTGLMAAIALAEAAAQPPVERDSSAALVTAVLTAIREPGGTVFAANTLRQVSRRLPQEVLDEIADSLAAIAIRLPPTRDNIYVIQSAVGALGLASLAEGEGAPYPGGAHRLLRIIYAGGSYAGGALYVISRLPDRTAAMVSMERLAVSENRLAHEAVRYLSEAFGDTGIAVLERLYRRREIRSAIALEVARRYAKRAGWPDPPAGE